VQRNLQGFATLLKVLTKTFLLDDPANFHFNSERIKRAIDDHHSSFTSLKKNLSEAKLETPFDARIRGNCSKYQKVVDSLNRLAQHLAGLRSSCGLQHEIMMKQREDAKYNLNGDSKTKAERIAEALTANSDYHHSANSRSGFSSGPSFSGNDSVSSNDFVGQANAYQLYLDAIGPHMRSLVFTCCRSLRNLRTAFASNQASYSQAFSTSGANFSAFNNLGGASEIGNQTQEAFENDPSFESLSQDLTLALNRFRHEQTIAVKHVYTIYPDSEKEYEKFKKDPKGLGGRGGGKYNRNGTSNDEDSNKPDEEIFVVFFFMFNLDEFAMELEELVKALEQIRIAEQAIVERKKWSLSARIKWSLKSRFVSDSKEPGESFATTAGTSLVSLLLSSYCHLMSILI